MPLAGVVAFEGMRLVLADVEPAHGDELGIGLPPVGAIEARVEPFQSAQEALAGGAITTPAFPVNQSARSTIPSLPDPELPRLFFR